MAKKKTYLAKAAVERLMRDAAGAERVSADAIDELVRYLEEVAREISSKAVELARHAGRKTVTKEDVRLASQ